MVELDRWFLNIYKLECILHDAVFIYLFIESKESQSYKKKYGWPPNLTKKITVLSYNVGT